jgi:hypothetical protein
MMPVPKRVNVDAKRLGDADGRTQTCTSHLLASPRDDVLRDVISRHSSRCGRLFVGSLPRTRRRRDDRKPPYVIDNYLASRKSRVARMARRQRICPSVLTKIFVSLSMSFSSMTGLITSAVHILAYLASEYVGVVLSGDDDIVKALCDAVFVFDRDLRFAVGAEISEHSAFNARKRGASPVQLP